MNGNSRSGTMKGSAMEDEGFHGEQTNANGAELDDVLPLAIVGMACRLPDGVRTAEDLWEMCSLARSGWTQMPSGRFKHDNFYHPDPAKLGSYNAKGACFLQEDVGLFDAAFFNITAEEAIAMDPQQRLLLECTYEALQNGGITKESIAGSNTGVFVGGATSDYDHLLLEDVQTTPMYTALGCEPSILSNRLSYFFDLRGPSLTLDTACSSSLVALHMACQSLRSGESSQVIVGGAHLNLLPDQFIKWSNQRLFSNEGKCFSFDERATSGYGRGEGIGCIIVRPLKDALKARNPVRAVIVNSGMNQDGRTNGITLPNQQAQEQLIRSVYDKAGIDVRDTGYVEAHGTGTRVGDPLEAAALRAVFCQERTSQDPLLVGSVKANVGHLEQASGIVSIIKAVLCLQKGFVPPNANFDVPNSAIPLEKWNLKVLKGMKPWPKGKKYASINNFGFGGANCHVVLRKAPWLEEPKSLPAIGRAEVRITVQNAKALPRFVFLMTAHTRESLETQIKNLDVYLEQRHAVYEVSLLGDLAYTLCERRSFLPFRIATSAATPEELITKLTSHDLSPVRASGQGRLGFVYTGQGAQWYAMGRELFAANPVFASTIQRAAAVIASLGASWSLIGLCLRINPQGCSKGTKLNVDELYRESSASQLGHAHVSQPAVTAIQIALTAMLATWDVRPSSVMGHSSGEIAASYAAGILSLEAAMKVAYFRGQVTSDFKHLFPNLKGAMMAVGCNEAQLQPMLEKLTRGKVVVAANNSPSSLTVSGDEIAILELQQVVEDQCIFNRKLRVEMAYHSHHMELVAEKYMTLLSGITPMDVSGVDFYSTVTGFKVKSLELQPNYWVANLVSRVRFSETLMSMCGEKAADRVGTFIEVGPHSALEGPIRQTLKGLLNSNTPISYTSCLLRNKNAVETSMQLAAYLCMRGYPLDFEAVNDPMAHKSRKLLVDMPPYAWQHDERYWHESRVTRNRRFKKAPRHDLLGLLADETNDFEAEWRNVLRFNEVPWIEQHRVQSTGIFPFTGYVVMAMEAMRQRALSRNLLYHSFIFRDIAVARPLSIDPMIDVETRTTLRPQRQSDTTDSGVWEELQIHSWTKDSGWVEHCRCLIGVQQKTSKENSVDGPRQIQDSRRWIQNEVSLALQNCSTEIDTTVMYHDLDAAGLAFGEVFRGLQACRASSTRAMADVSAPDTASLMPEWHEPGYQLHPVTFDIITQVLWPCIGAGRTGGLSCLYLPTFIRELEIAKELPETSEVPFRVYGCKPPHPAISTRGNLECSYFAMHPNHGDLPCIRAEGHRLTPVRDGAEESSDDNARDLCYKLSWEPRGRLHFESSSPMQQSGSSDCNDGSQLSEIVSISKLFDALKDCTGQSPALDLFQDVSSEGKVLILLMELDSPCLSSLELGTFERIKSVISSSKGIIWPIRGGYQGSTSPDLNMVNGFARTVRAETGLKFITIDLDQQSSPSDAADTIAEVFSRAFVEQSPHAAEMEYMERSGGLHVPRLTSDAPLNDFIRLNAGTGAWGAHPQDFVQTGRPLKLTVERPGSLDSIGFVDDERLMTPIGNDEVEVDVKAISLNFKDVVIAMGQLPGGLVGQECSGIVTKAGGLSKKDFKVGDRVCAYSPGCLANRVRCKASSTICIPERMSFELAATLPVVYCTAYYSLIDIGRLSKGEKVLIHAAAGGVGQAALGLAQMIGAEVFATVGNELKKDFLMQNFGIDSDHIFYSRDTSFKAGIMRMTDNQGVDVVLNSLAGSMLQTTLECLTAFGRFIEIGKRDIVENTRMEMAPFARNIIFASVDLAVVAVDRPSLMQRLLEHVMDLYRTDRLRLISPLASLPISEVQSAIRTLQGGKTLGKLVVVPDSKDQVMASPSRIPQHLLPTSGTYVIVGGTGGIGRSIAEWMIEKGARCLALVSRSGVNEKLGGLMARAEAYNATIAVHQCDVGNEDDVKTLVGRISQEMPAIKGVVHSAMVLHDTLFEDLTYEQYQAVIRSKVNGVWNLHHALSKVSLDFFIALSSASGIVGNRGQAAYAAANTFLDAFSQYRQSQGLPMTTIDLTAVKEVGYLAEDDEKAALVEKTLGTTAVGEKELHCLVAAAIMGQMKSSCNNHCITGLGVGRGSAVPPWMLDPKFEHIRPAMAEQQKGSPTQKASLRESIQRSENEKTTLQLIQDALLEKVASVLMIPILDIDPDKPITSYGLDSLIAIEIRNWIGRNCQATLQVLELLSSGSWATLSRLIMRKSKLVPQVLPNGDR